MSDRNQDVDEYVDAWRDDKPDEPKKRPGMSAREMARGVKEAVVDPIAEDFKQAYWMQRAARTRNPKVDAALNFVPYVGVAAAADDLQHAVREGDKAGSVANAVEVAVNPTTMKAGLRAGIKAVSDDTPVVRKKFGQTYESARGFVGKKMAGALGLASGAGAAANYYGHAQNDANEKYGDRPLKEIAQELRDEYAARQREREEFAQEWNDQ